MVENVLLSVELFRFAGKSIDMLTLIPIYLFGKSYYDLAKLHKRNAWIYGVFGGFIFLMGQFLFAFLIGLLIVAADIRTDLPDFVFSLAAIAFSAGVAYFIENRLKKNWEGNPRDDFSESDLLDQ